MKHPLREAISIILLVIFGSIFTCSIWSHAETPHPYNHRHQIYYAAPKTIQWRRGAAFHTIPDLLTPDEVNHLLEFSKTHLFADGKGSNEEFELKNNLQANPQDPAAQQTSAIVQNALFRNEWVRDIAIPKSLASPMVTKYTPGMEYGEHVDTHVVTGSIPVRVDISCTVFLNDPEAYDGGELIVRLADKTLTIKEKAGTAFLYPSANQYHRVAPVTRGERIVAVTFMQSHIRDQSKRAILYELQGFLNEYGESLTSEAQMQLEYVRTNLMRMWYED